MDFKPEHKEDMSFGGYFDFGVHKVKIVGFRLDVTEGGKEFVEVGFCNEDGTVEDSARVWFTTDNATKYSFNVLKSILIHNTPEDKRELAAKAADEVPNTQKLVELLEKKLPGGEMWFTKYLDPERTYQDQRGVTRQSTNKNIYSYEPKLNQLLMPHTLADMASQAKETFEEEKYPFPSGEAKKDDGGWA